VARKNLEIDWWETTISFEKLAYYRLANCILGQCTTRLCQRKGYSIERLTRISSQTRHSSCVNQSIFLFSKLESEPSNAMSVDQGQHLAMKQQNELHYMECQLFTFDYFYWCSINGIYMTLNWFLLFRLLVLVNFNFKKWSKMADYVAYFELGLQCILATLDHLQVLFTLH